MSLSESSGTPSSRCSDPSDVNDRCGLVISTSSLNSSANRLASPSMTASKAATSTRGRSIGVSTTGWWTTRAGPARRSPRLEQQTHSTSVVRSTSHHGRYGRASSGASPTVGDAHAAGERITRSGRCGRRPPVRTVTARSTSTEPGEIHMTMRRTRIVRSTWPPTGPWTSPRGPTIISLQFESEGAYGYDTRPARVWVDVRLRHGRHLIELRGDGDGRRGQGIEAQHHRVHVRRRRLGRSRLLRRRREPRRADAAPRSAGRRGPAVPVVLRPAELHARAGPRR